VPKTTAETIEAGDRVRVVKIPGPVMLVARLDGDDAHCVWFDGNAACGRSFPVEILQPDNAPGQDQSAFAKSLADDERKRSAAAPPKPVPKG
jgi:uncharacterized protein YodC (DUF2158 family)